MKKKDNRKKYIVIAGIVVVVIVLVIIASLFDRADNRKAAAAADAITAQGAAIDDGSGEDGGNAAVGVQTLFFGDDEYEITHNIETYLLMGTDDTGNVEAAGTKDYLGQMADFLLLLVLDRTENTYGFIQMNRDTMVDVPYMDYQGNGQGAAFEQLCIAHWYGGDPEMGCNNTSFCVSELLGGLKIDGYYSIHMSDIGILNHAVDGVEVTLEDDFSSADKEMTEGKTLTLSDAQAELFVRGRMGIGDGKNSSRMRRQMQYMQNFKKKALDRIGSDPDFVDDLLDALKQDAVTDLPQNRISMIANQLHKNKDLGILTYDGEDKEGDTLKDGVIHAEFYADEDSIAEIVTTLCNIDEEHIFRYEP